MSPPDLTDEQLAQQLPDIAPDQPVLIAGPTASGKSALALHIAQTSGGVILNADALQVFDGWRILTARPPDADLAIAPHRLYGHVPADDAYSVGHWLRDIGPLLQDARPIIVGGTGLYFAALTNGLAPIPATPASVRATGDEMTLGDMLDALDAQTIANIDIQNRARVQRAWEVQTATGQSIAAWQAQTPPPLLPLDQTCPLVMMPEPDWLNDRIAQRFDQMLDQGVMEEARLMRDGWDPAAGSSKAIGAAALIAHLDGALTLEQTREAVVTATRQYGKRQRTWFRSKMADWHQIRLG